MGVGRGGGDINIKMLGRASRLIPWIRGSPAKKAQQTEHRLSLSSLARPADGLLGLGSPGLVLEPLIQGSRLTKMGHKKSRLPFRLMTEKVDPKI